MSNTEIERKFLIDTSNIQSLISQSTHTINIKQGYLGVNDNCTTRVRIEHDDNATNNNKQSSSLTIKSGNGAIVRDEYVIDVEPEIANGMIKLATGTVYKTRYVLEGFHDCEPSNAYPRNVIVDVFHQRNEGLVILEIELLTEDTDISDYDGIIESEVTDDVDYYNSSLSEKPYLEWFEG